MGVLRGAIVSREGRGCRSSAKLPCAKAIRIHLQPGQLKFCCAINIIAKPPLVKYDTFLLGLLKSKGPSYQGAPAATYRLLGSRKDQATYDRVHLRSTVGS